jgi:GH15 family glucan-1,4-alpha-glucosidase
VRPLEDYALIGDMHTAALVGRDGSIDWLCLPRFDSAACFAALLGTERHGLWRIAPTGAGDADRRGYRPDTLILESEWDTPTGAARLIDFMPLRDRSPDIVRIVEGVSGQVEMRCMLRIRFDYGRAVPWVRQLDGQLAAIAGPDALYLRADVPTYGRDLTTYADFTVREGERVAFVLTFAPSFQPPPRPAHPYHVLDATQAFWRAWVRRCTYRGPYRNQVVRSLIILKALTYCPTGGIVAAATTSVPEDLGGVRNWDYRYCWLRDSTLTLEALLRSGYVDEARAWRHWLVHAIAGSPQDLQIMYGVAGERRLTEQVLDWLPGYENAAPVRIGNAAVYQLQLDVYGEVLDTLYLARRHGLERDPDAWRLQRALLRHLADHWHEPDEGIWEVRGPRRHFTHSKVMAWVAFDRAIRTAEEFADRGGPIDHWRAVRELIHEEIAAKAFDAERMAFTQYYGARDLDASLLLMPVVGFLPPDDPRIAGTIDAIQRELSADGFVRRYPTVESKEGNVDGIPGDEGAFLACSFWLADCLNLVGRTQEATELFERLLGLCNDLGLLSEEYSVRHGRQLGNLPQAFSHVALINTAMNLSEPSGAIRARVGEADRSADAP